MKSMDIDPVFGNDTMTPRNEFKLERLNSGIGLSVSELEHLRTSQGFELCYAGKLRYILPWLYVYKAWSTPLNRYIYLHHVWDYYEEVIDSCFIMFEGHEDAENDRDQNEAFINKYLQGKFENVGRPREQWEVCGKMYDKDDDALLFALKNDVQHTSKIYDVTADYYKLPSGDYLSYDVNDNKSLRIVNETEYRIDMLSRFEREHAWDAEMHRHTELMRSSPKYHPFPDWP